MISSSDAAFEPVETTRIEAAAPPPRPSGGWDWEELDRPRPSDVVEAEAAREARHAEELELTFQHGYREGQMATRADLNRHVRTAISAASAAARALGDRRAAWEARLGEDLAALAVGIARQIVGREITTSPEIVAELVQSAVETFPTDHALRVRVHPSDLRTLTAALDGHDEHALAARTLRWTPDEDVQPGGCVVEGPTGIVDGRVDQALERIYHKLTHG